MKRINRIYEITKNEGIIKMIKINTLFLASIVALFLTNASAEELETKALTSHLKCACGKKNGITETTFAMIKPEAVQAGTTGDIIKQIELNGFKIKDIIKKSLTREDAEQFYKEHKDKPFFRNLVTYMTSGPAILLALEKENAVSDWRKLMGSTDATKADVGTLRKMFGKSMQENAVHGSANLEDAKNELAFLALQMNALNHNIVKKI